MKWKFQNEEGMTLVELLAAIVLLGIVLVAFMSFFTQSAKFTAHNHETLTAVQVAEEVVADVRNISELKKMEDIEGKDYEFKNGRIKDVLSYKPYSVVVEEMTAPMSVNIKLKKAIITVKSASGAGIDEPEFKTEMYFKVK